MSQPEEPFSILFADALAVPTGGCDGWPEEIRDLNLDNVFNDIVLSRTEYDLAPYLGLLLPDERSVKYRQAVFHDLWAGGAVPVNAFAVKMGQVRSRLLASKQRDHPYEKGSWLLAAGQVYCDAVSSFHDALVRAQPASEGLRRCAGYLTAYLRSEPYTRLAVETRRLAVELASVRYSVTVRGGHVSVAAYRGESDYSSEVLATFAKFRPGHLEYSRTSGEFEFQNPVQQMILDRVAVLYPALFASLLTYLQEFADFVDPQVCRFDREVQLYLAYLAVVDEVCQAGLTFCLPEVSVSDKEVCVHDTFDLALARKRVGERHLVVVNNVELSGGERIAVVTGPNQGGKTTFARTFGQLHYLAALGFPIPGSSGRLPLCDAVLSHFVRQERLDDLQSGLEAELGRVQKMLARATPRSVLIMNESFASTSSADQYILGREVIGRLVSLDLLGVYVTFVDELSRLGPAIVSLVATVSPSAPSQRTFKVVRRPADGQAYSRVLVGAHRLTYEAILSEARSW